MVQIPQPFRLYVDRLREMGREERIEESVDSKELDLEEEDLRFPAPVQFVGRAYQAGDQLIVQLTIRTQVQAPCPVCNEPTTLPLELKDLMMPLDKESAVGGILDLRGPLRDEILLAVPRLAECRPEGCPNRQLLARFLKPS